MKRIDSDHELMREPFVIVIDRNTHRYMPMNDTGDSIELIIEPVEPRKENEDEHVLD